MSFSSAVKNELCRLENEEGCCLFAEVTAAVRIAGMLKKTENSSYNIRLITENAAFARRMYSNIKKLYNINLQVIIRRSSKLKKHASYILLFHQSIPDIDNIIKEKLTERNQKIKKSVLEQSIKDKDSVFYKNCCRRAYLRGAFLAGGSISDPEKTYHLEITTHYRRDADIIQWLMSTYQLNAKIINRKGSYVVYLKEGENIVDFLNIIGAHSALLEFENIRILKDMRNNVNRIVNCETANLEKTVNASVRQIDNINLIQKTIGFSKLPGNLREIAELRLEYTDASLKELGEMMTPPLGKSGVNHRLRKLDEIAEEIRMHRQNKGL